jgi:hypothetical protein
VAANSDEGVRLGVTHLLTSYQYLADTGKVEQLARHHLSSIYVE